MVNCCIDNKTAGLYAIRARVYASQGGPELANATLGHDGWIDGSFDITATWLPRTSSSSLERRLATAFTVKSTEMRSLLRAVP